MENQKILEDELLSIFGDDELKEIAQSIAWILREHNLQRRPGVCRKLFLHLSDVVDGWNAV